MGILDFITGGKSSRVFLMGGSNPTAPKQFGYAIVKAAIDNTSADVGEMFGKRESEIQKRIYQKAQGAQLTLIALQAAVVYVYALKLLAVPKDTLAELYEGMTAGFDKLLGNSDGTVLETSFAILLEKLLRLYSQSLHEELSNASLNEDPLNLGQTASLVVETIGELCGIGECLKSNANALEIYQLRQIAARNGILLLMGFWNKRYIDYRQ